jgi:type I restriction enzyme S subunit
MNKCTINDIALNIGSGMTPLRSNMEFWNSSDYPWLKTEQLGTFQIYDTEEYISKAAFEQTTIKLWPPKTISVAMYGEGQTRGKVSIIMKEMATNQACCNIVVNPDVADYRYVYYWLKNNYEQLRVLSSGVRKNLNSDDIKNFPIIVPDLPIQEQIVNVLYVLDKKIELNNRIITELEEMAKTIFDYWFVQFDYPNSKGKPYCSSGGKMVWNEKMKREIPNGWRVCLVSDLLDKVPNTTRIKSSEYLLEGSIPVIDQSTDLIAGYTNEELAVISINDGAIIFGDHTRIIKFIGFDFARGADGTQVLISNNKKNMPQLLFYYSIQKIDLSNYGYARHFKFLKDSLIVVPNEEVAQRFNEIVEPLHKVISHKIFQNLELTKLRDWLLPMLMNGQVSVKNKLMAAITK